MYVINISLHLWHIINGNIYIFLIVYSLIISALQHLVPSRAKGLLLCRYLQSIDLTTKQSWRPIIASK